MERLSLPSCEQKRARHPFQRLPIPLKMFYKTEDPFIWLPHCLSLFILPFDFSSSLLLSLWSIKEPGIQTPIRWLFWSTSLPSSLSAPFWIKLFSLLQYLISQIHWPVLWRTEWAWTWVQVKQYSWRIFHFLNEPEFIYPPTKGHLGSFQVLAFMYKVTINIIS